MHSAERGDEPINSTGPSDSDTGFTGQGGRCLGDPYEVMEAKRRVIDERIGVLAAQIHSLQAELIDTLVEFDDAGGWQSGGFRSMSQWLSIRTKFTATESQRLASVVASADRVPLLLDAARQGRVSVGLLGVAARVSTPDNEAKVASIILDCTPAQAGRVLSKYRDLKHTIEPDDDVEAPDDGAPAAAPEPDPEYWWRIWYDESNRGRLDAAMDPVTTALMEQAWAAARAAGEHDEHDECCGAEQADGESGDSCSQSTDATAGTAADTDAAAATGTATDPAADEPAGTAAVPETADEKFRRLSPNEIAARLAATMIDHAHDQGLSAPGGERFAVQLNIDVATLASILGITLDPALPIQLGTECFLADTGRHLSEREAAEFLCDAGIQVLVSRNGVPLWLSNETRTANRQQRRAMRFRSGGRGGCEFPGCTQTRYVDAHHVVFHSKDGPTTLDNMALLCGYHHRRLHKENWTVTTNGAQVFTFWDGTRCLGTTNAADRPGGRPPDLQQLPGLAQPPDPPPGIDGNTPKSATRGERMTPYALNSFLERLLLAA